MRCSLVTNTELEQNLVPHLMAFVWKAVLDLGDFTKQIIVHLEVTCDFLAVHAPPRC